MRFIRIVINITIPIFLVLLFANVLTTKPYLMISKNLYESHDQVDFDYEYAIDHIMGYLNYRYDNLEFGKNADDNSIILRDIEIRHMVDVKTLYTHLRIVGGVFFLIGGALIVLQYKKDKQELYKTLKYMPVVPIFLIMFIGGYLLIDFNAAFTEFHHIFFSNNDWLLRYDDVLIILLPSNFWMVSGLIILGCFTISLGFLYFWNEKVFKKRLK